MGDGEVEPGGHLHVSLSGRPASGYQQLALSFFLQPHFYLSWSPDLTPSNSQVKAGLGSDANCA